MNDVMTPTTPETVQPQWVEHLKEAAEKLEAKEKAEVAKLEAEIKVLEDEIHGKSAL